MGRQSNRREAKQSTQKLELNFYFSTPSSTSQPRESSSQRSNKNNHRRNHRHEDQQYQRTAQDRASARRKAKTAMFFLHSSADHVFFLSRSSSSKVSGESHSFSGSSEPVDWQTVKLVKEIVPLNTEQSLQQPQCPICLSACVCARITKCGHTFCLPCILRHVQSTTENNPYEHVKCPCCAIPMLVGDLRPVFFETVVNPAAQCKIKLVKLHRQKNCSAPYFPMPQAPKHSNPHTAPTMGEPDAKFCRFNYMDPAFYVSFLSSNLEELKQELDSLPINAVERLFFAMAFEIVLKGIQQAQDQLPDEEALRERFQMPASGMYENQTSTRIPVSTQLIDPYQKAGSRSQRSGSMYLEEADAVQFYQAEDGQLVFMNGFNISCLLSDFSRSSTNLGGPPLPDSVEGNILELETVHFTPEVRKRMPCLSHLPLYIDIKFVELDLNHILSVETKLKFKAEFTKRRKRRKSRAQAEKRADREARKEEAERINERKARLHLIDPRDDFFHASLPEESPLTGETFGPIVGRVGEDAPLQEAASNKDMLPTISFSEACQGNNDVVRISTEEFPALGARPTNITSRSEAGKSPQKAPFSSLQDKPSEPAVQGKKKTKGKGQKLVLFSTGGHRGSIY